MQEYLYYEKSPRLITEETGNVEEERKGSSSKRPRGSETPTGPLLQELCMFCEKAKRIKETHALT